MTSRAAGAGLNIPVHARERSLPVAVTATANCPDVLALASAHHSNAIRVRPRHLVVDFPPMADVARACNSIFERVDREDVVQRQAASLAWRLKTTLMLTVLPFDDPRLGLDGLLGGLRHVVDVVPDISEPVFALKRLIDGLRSAADNPKRVKVLELLDVPGADWANVGLLASLCGSSTPGWPADISSAADFGGRVPCLIRLRNQVRDELFSRVIIPGSPRGASVRLMADICHGGLSPEVVLVSYRAENARLPRPFPMPPDPRMPRVADPASSELEDESRESVEETRIDRWAHEQLWTSIRAQYADVTPVSDTDVTVPARFVLFADGSGAFLPENGSVVEISTVYDTGSMANTPEDRLPRRAVRDLEEGHLVMLRLSGSGDYLEDVADALMQRSGEPSLRGDALRWKGRLHEALKEHGEGVVAQRLRAAGGPLKSPHYLWQWAGSAVMAPHDLATFRCLVAAVRGLGRVEAGGDSERYADDRWSEMERVKAYQYKAGSAIRAALLSRVRELVAQRTRIDTVESIELPGVAAGRMGLLRVSAVDITSMRVPTSRLFRLDAMKVS